VKIIDASKVQCFLFSNILNIVVALFGNRNRTMTMVMAMAVAVAVAIESLGIALD